MPFLITVLKQVGDLDHLQETHRICHSKALHKNWCILRITLPRFHLINVDMLIFQLLLLQQLFNGLVDQIYFTITTMEDKMPLLRLTVDLQANSQAHQTMYKLCNPKVSLIVNLLLSPILRHLVSYKIQSMLQNLFIQDLITIITNSSSQVQILIFLWDQLLWVLRASNNMLNNLPKIEVNSTECSL